jgi:hypothetical protein
VPAASQVDDVGCGNKDATNERENDFERKTRSHKANAESKKPEDGKNEHLSMAMNTIARKKRKNAGGKNNQCEQDMDPWTFKINPENRQKK